MFASLNVAFVKKIITLVRYKAILNDSHQCFPMQIILQSEELSYSITKVPLHRLHGKQRSNIVT